MLTKGEGLLIWDKIPQFTGGLQAFVKVSG